MANTTNRDKIADRDVFYYRRRIQNRVFSELAAFFADKAKRSGITKRAMADRIGRDPALITRWLAAPSNLTLETISDLLLALDAEMDCRIVRFEDRPKPNVAHPIIARLLKTSAAKSGPHLRTEWPENVERRASETGAGVHAKTRITRQQNDFEPA